jgi:hypothetical protein
MIGRGCDFGVGVGAGRAEVTLLWVFWDSRFLQRYQWLKWCFWPSIIVPIEAIAALCSLPCPRRRGLISFDFAGLFPPSRQGIGAAMLRWPAVTLGSSLVVSPMSAAVRPSVRKGTLTVFVK